MITDRELLLATANRQREERILYYAEFVGECWTNALNYYNIPDMDTLYSEMGFYNPKDVRPIRKPDAPVFDFSEYFSDIKIPDGVSIGPDGVLNLPGSDFHFTHIISPLRNVYDYEDILKFPIFKRKEYYDFSGLKAQVDKLHAEGKVARAWVGRLFENSWPLRGYENMLADMLADPDTAELFLNIEFEWNMEFAVQAASAGADILYFGDDVGNQNNLTFSRELWQQMLKPKWAKIFSAAKKINPNIVIWYHSCGHITEIIPDLIDVGLDILNPLQPECMDIYEIQKKYGDKLSFDGGLGTQTVMPFGTVNDVISETEHLVNIFGANGGYILAPSHVLEPEVPMENIDAFIKTAKKICFR